MVNPYATRLINPGQHDNKKSLHQSHQKEPQDMSSYADQQNRKRDLNFTSSVPSKKAHLNNPPLSSTIHHTLSYDPNFMKFNAPNQTCVPTVQPLPVQESDTCLKALQESSKAIVSDIQRELALFETRQAQDLNQLMNARRLLDFELQKLFSNMDPDWMEVESSNYKIVLKKRLLLPNDGRNANIVGRLLGHKGLTLKQICQTYRCSIGIFGKGSAKDGEEKLKSRDPQHSHFNLPLHLEISITDKPDEAYTRFGQIMNFIRHVVANPQPFEINGISITGDNNFNQQTFNSGWIQPMHQGQFAGGISTFNKFNAHSLYQNQAKYDGNFNYGAAIGQSNSVQEKQTMGEASHGNSSNPHLTFQAMKFNESDGFKKKPQNDKLYNHSAKQGEQCEYYDESNAIVLE